MRLRFLNNREKKQIFGILSSQFGYAGELDYEFMISEKKRLYIINKEIREFPLDELKVNSMGLYFGELYDNQIRLSIEGSQIIGPYASHNIIDIDSGNAWMQGRDMPTDYTSDYFVIVRCGRDFMGCGRIKNKRLLNFVPKARRLNIK